MQIEVLGARRSAKVREGRVAAETAQIRAGERVPLRQRADGTLEFFGRDRRGSRLLDQRQNRAFGILHTLGIHAEREGDRASVRLVLRNRGDADVLGVPGVQMRLRPRERIVHQNRKKRVQGERIRASPGRGPESHGDPHALGVEVVLLDRRLRSRKTLLAESGAGRSLSPRHLRECRRHFLQDFLRVHVSRDDDRQILGEVVIVVEALDQRGGDGRELLHRYRERPAQGRALMQPRPDRVHRGELGVGEGRFRERLGSAHRP